MMLQKQTYEPHVGMQLAVSIPENRSFRKLCRISLQQTEMDVKRDCLRTIAMAVRHHLFAGQGVCQTELRIFGSEGKFRRLGEKLGNLSCG